MAATISDKAWPLNALFQVTKYRHTLSFPMVTMFSWSSSVHSNNMVKMAKNHDLCAKLLLQKGCCPYNCYNKAHRFMFLVDR